MVILAAERNKGRGGGDTYVKSPVASGALTCSSVKNRVRVTMSVLMPSWPTGGAPPLFAILEEEKGMSGWVENGN